MRIHSSFRSLFMAGSAIALLAACSDATVESEGDGTPLTIVPVVNTGGSSSGPAAFAASSTQPTSAADCPAGTTFISAVNVLSSANQRNFCSLVPLTTTGTTTSAVSQTITGTVSVPFSEDPILIPGTVFIGDGSDGSANVTFAAGQKFVSESNAGDVDLLVVSRGSQLNAVGTATNPIIFSTMQDYADDGEPNGSTSAGEWGGIAINGKAQLNECTVDTGATAGTDACRQNGEGGSGEFGGADNTDSSGRFAYIRVQQAGFDFTPTNQLNGIALQGVGSGTEFHHIQVHKGKDDGFEWFGGAVNASNLVVTGAADDALDWTDGWVGSLQFALVVQNDGNDNGIEGDNNGDTDPDDLPRSNPDLSNITLIGDGAGSGEGLHLRAGTNATVANILVTNFQEGFEFDDEGTGPTPVVTSLGLSGNVVQLKDSDAIFNASATNQQFAGGSTLDGVIPGANESSITPTDATSVNGNFITADYAGAFGGTDTKESNWTTGWTIDGSIPGTGSPGCPAGTTDVTAEESTVLTGRTETVVCQLPTTILGSLNLVSGNLYRMSGTTFVGIDRGADPATDDTTEDQEGLLTIDPGVTLFGNCNGAANLCGDGAVDLLVVSRGSKIFVNGSSTSPAIMTSRADLESGSTAIRSGATGEIGGLAVNGRALLNECTVDTGATPGTVDCEQNGEGGSGVFGGATADDDSGRINYLQIRYAGFDFTPTNQLNSIALQGVGSDTEIDFVQIINGKDDGIEWFGGAVSASHIIVTGAGDDSLDWTDGWVGTLQYAYVAQNAGDDAGIEADNNGDTDPDDTPRSAATVSNITIVGGPGGEAMHMRAGVAGNFLNIVLSNGGQGIEFDREGTGPDPVLNGVAVLDNNGSQLDDDAPSLDTGTNIVTGVAAANLAGTPVPVFDAVTAGVTPVDPSGVDASLDAATFIGAFENASDDWYAGWTLGIE